MQEIPLILSSANSWHQKLTFVQINDRPKMTNLAPNW